MDQGKGGREPEIEPWRTQIEGHDFAVGGLVLKKGRVDLDLAILEPRIGRCDMDLGHHGPRKDRREQAKDGRAVLKGAVVSRNETRRMADGPFIRHSGTVFPTRSGEEACKDRPPFSSVRVETDMQLALTTSFRSKVRMDPAAAHHAVTLRYPPQVCLARSTVEVSEWMESGMFPVAILARKRPRSPGLPLSF